MFIAIFCKILVQVIPITTQARDLKFVWSNSSKVVVGNGGLNSNYVWFPRGATEFTNAT